MRRIEDIFKDEQNALIKKMLDFVSDERNPLIERYKVLQLSGKIKGDIEEVVKKELFYKWISSTEYLTRYKIYTYDDMLEHMGYDIDSDYNPKQKETNPSMEEILTEAVEGTIFGCVYDW